MRQRIISYHSWPKEALQPRPAPNVRTTCSASSVLFHDDSLSSSKQYALWGVAACRLSPRNRHMLPRRDVGLRSHQFHRPVACTGMSWACVLDSGASHHHQIPSRRGQCSSSWLAVGFSGIFSTCLRPRKDRFGTVPPLGCFEGTTQFQRETNVFAPASFGVSGGFHEKYLAMGEKPNRPGEHPNPH